MNQPDQNGVYGHAAGLLEWSLSGGDLGHEQRLRMLEMLAHAGGHASAHARAARVAAVELGRDRDEHGERIGRGDQTLMRPEQTTPEQSRIAVDAAQAEVARLREHQAAERAAREQPRHHRPPTEHLDPVSASRERGL